MLAGPNFPTFIGNSPAIDTINLIVPLHMAVGCLPQPCGAAPHFNCLCLVSKLISSISDLMFLQIFMVR